jgi:hypothetical protein
MRTVGADILVSALALRQLTPAFASMRCKRFVVLPPPEERVSTKNQIRPALIVGGLAVRPINTTHKYRAPLRKRRGGSPAKDRPSEPVHASGVEQK